jgi:peptidoglycan/xylan/chitin deacetylase (PgdA/CDA1 family)
VRPLVLCYHAVSDGWPHLLSVRPAELERQLASLVDRGYRPVPAREMAEGQGRLLHVTFDDAFASVHNALAALERLGVPATVFVCPGFADDGRPPRIPELAAEVDGHPEELRTMGWDEVRSLAERPDIEIGAHTVSHPHLRELSDPELEREVVESRQRIEAELGRPCPFFAYPYGEHDERVRRAVHAAGYEAAFGLQPESSAWGDCYRLPRVGVWRGDSERTFGLKTSALGRSLPVSVLRRARNRLA